MMTAFWLQNLLFYGLQVLLVVLAGGALVWTIRFRDPRIELFYLQGVLAVCLLLPFLQPWQAPELDATPQALPAVVGVDTFPDDDGSPDGPFSPFRVAAWLLAAGAGIRFAWIGVGFWRLARYRDQSEELAVPPSFAAVLQAQLGTSAMLRVSSEVRGPVTFGWLRPVVLLPERFLEFAPDLQKAILCHELLHVRRRDWLFTVAEESIRALLWFHPAVWWLIGRIHLVREQLVDRETIRLTDSRDPYLRALLAVAGHQIQPDLAPASLFLRKHHLDQRVAAVVRKEIPMSKVRSIAWLSLMSSAVVAAVWVSASTFPLQAVPQATDWGNRVILSPTGVVEQGGENLLQEPVVPYPQEAIAKRVEGRVVLELSVDADGRVYDALVISGPQQLRRAALMSVLQWRYSNQISLPAKVVATVQFRLPPPGSQPQARPREANGQPPKRIRVRDAVQHARLTHKVTPEYPALARQAEVEGTVRLSITISPTGTVDYIDVASGHPLLIPAALQSVKQWEYKPTLLNGTPVEVETNVDIQFSLDGGIATGPADPGTAGPAANR